LAFGLIADPSLRTARLQHRHDRHLADIGRGLAKLPV
jgi:hypothetical protein